MRQNAVNNLTIYYHGKPALLKKLHGMVALFGQEIKQKIHG